MDKTQSSFSFDGLNFPNMLSLARLLMTPMVMWGLLRKEHLFAFIVVILAAITDLLDGLAARSFDQKTTLGAILDPIADKVFFTCVFLTMGFGLHLFPNWFSYAVLGRDLFIVLGYVMLKFLGRSTVVAPTWWGKWYTTILFLLIIAKLYWLHLENDLPYESYLLGGTCVFLMVSLLSYVKEFLKRSH